MAYSDKLGGLEKLANTRAALRWIPPPMCTVTIEKRNFYDSRPIRLINDGPAQANDVHVELV